MLKIIKNIKLAPYTTLKIGQTAEFFAIIKSKDELLEAISWAKNNKQEITILGGGSNVLIASKIKGLVIKNEIKGSFISAETNNDAWLTGNSGEIWSSFVYQAVSNKLYGLENLYLIYGTVGAAPIQNIGAYGLELEQRVHSVLAWSFKEGRLLELSAPECGFAYRDSRFKRDPAGSWLIVAVRFMLPRPWMPVLEYPDLNKQAHLAGKPDPETIFQAVCDIRRQKLPDPKVLANAGSFFKNPVVQTAQRDALKQQWPDLVSYDVGQGRCKLAAGWLIEQCGWKGRTDGAVGVHDRQALVLVNHGGGTAADIGRLATAIRASVRERFGVELEQEPVVVA